MSESVEEIYEKLDVLGEDWADKDAAFHALDDATKTILSICIGKINSDTMSMAAKETVARRDREYQEHQTAVESARRNANIARVNYDNFKIYVELLRSRAATKRAAMTLR